MSVAQRARDLAGPAGITTRHIEQAMATEPQRVARVADELPRLRCGCEPAWRCKQHAKLAKQGRPDPASQAVVNLVYGRVSRNAGTGHQAGANGALGTSPDLGKCGTSRNASARTRRARSDRQHATNAERQRAYRARQRQAKG